MTQAEKIRIAVNVGGAAYLELRKAGLEGAEAARISTELEIVLVTKLLSGDAEAGT